MKEKQKEYEKNRRYPHQIKFRVSEKVHSELLKVAESKGITITDVCRNRINGLSYEPPLIDFKDSQQIIRGISILGGNLNQATKSLNTIALYLKRESGQKQDRFNFTSAPKLFVEERANELAEKLRVKKAEDLFKENVTSSFNFTFLSKDQQILLIDWIQNPQDRPVSKADFEESLQQKIYTIEGNIQKMKEDLDILCQLV